MKIGVFADIHANLPAFGKVIEFLKSKVGGFVCCGDIVGYGPHPNECIEMLQGLQNTYIVCGNHDLAVIGAGDAGTFSEDAAAAVEWTMGKLTDSSRSFLSGLERKITVDNFTAVHGSLIDPIKQYVTGIPDYIPSLRAQEKGLVFNGHTHRPLYFRAAEETVSSGFFNPGSPVKISDGSKYFINAGAVGQPRDGDPRASCVIYDGDAGTVTLYRLEYDIKSTQNDMRKTDSPLFLIERLGAGV
ncbi:MAG: metallophosphoesterase family protein [bacterium]